MSPIDERDAVEIVRLLNELRDNEGASVTFSCPNPDFNGLPDQCIDVSDDWTGWESRRFGGRTLLEALQAARQASADSLPTLLDCKGILKGKSDQ